jgi:hypothetical protein
MSSLADAGSRAEPFTPRLLVDNAMANPLNAELLTRLAALALPQCYLCAGSVFQATWNLASGRPADWGVKDYDVFYFDDRDLSWEAEDAVIQRVQACTADLEVQVEVRNQARVHLWYPQRFGAPYPRLASARDGIDRYLIACTCVGIEIATGEVYAPDSLQDVRDGILRINPRHRMPEMFCAKAASYRARWPWLTIAPIDTE